METSFHENDPYLDVEYIHLHNIARKSHFVLDVGHVSRRYVQLYMILEAAALYSRGFSKSTSADGVGNVI